MRVNYNELVEAALNARNNAHCPYSNFAVGAALLTDKGIYTGCNVENASYGLSMCAERAAIFKSVSEGCRQYVAIAVVADLPNGASPCGACRQVLREFGINLEVVISDTKGKFRVTNLKELLPDCFGPEFKKYHDRGTKNT